jgi:hypothetical protein
MDRTPTEAHRSSPYRLHLDAAMRRLRRPPLQAKAARRGEAYGANAMASFGMIVTLLMIWAMAVNM